METIPLLLASLLVAGNWVHGEEESDLDDPKVRGKSLKEAVLLESLDERGPNGGKLSYQAGKQAPFTGWAKGVYGNGQVAMLAHYKDGQKDGLWTAWDRDGKVVRETRYRDGVEVKE